MKTVLLRKLVDHKDNTPIYDVAPMPNNGYALLFLIEHPEYEPFHIEELPIIQAIETIGLIGAGIAQDCIDANKVGELSLEMSIIARDMMQDLKDEAIRLMNQRQQQDLSHPIHSN